MSNPEFLRISINEYAKLKTGLKDAKKLLAKFRHSNKDVDNWFRSYAPGEYKPERDQRPEPIKHPALVIKEHHP